MIAPEKAVRAFSQQGNILTLTLADNQEMRWELASAAPLPSHTPLAIRLFHPETEAQERSRLAAAVLNALLTPTVSSQRP